MASRDGRDVTPVWEEAIKRALKKKRPKKGWPKPKGTKKRKKASRVSHAGL